MSQETWELRLVLPLPPSVNHQYATVHGRRVLSRSGRAYKALVATALEEWQERYAPSASDVAVFRRHYLGLTITFFFSTALRRDLDGGLKITQDAVCEALGVNDNLVAEIHLHKRVDRLNPRIELSLHTLPVGVLEQDMDGVCELPPAPVLPRKRRKRRRQRSLEELAARYKWS
jgi:crossover junction endodeoxyribonuclease RusA